MSLRDTVAAAYTNAMVTKTDREIMTSVAPASLDDYCLLLNSRTPFTMANIGGDGEFLAITGAVGTNSDGRTFNPEIGAKLAQVLLEPRLTFHGYNPGKADGTKDGNKRAKAEAWLREHGINVPVLTDSALQDPDYGKAAINVRWCHKEIISSANARGQLAPFIRALRQRDVCVIASEHITHSDFAYRDLRAIDVGTVMNAADWRALDVISPNVARQISRLPEGAVVTWSLGYMTKVLMWELAPMRSDLTHIDVGACWDPYCGVYNRHGYRMDSWKEAMQRNLEGAAELAGGSKRQTGG